MSPSFNVVIVGFSALETQKIERILALTQAKILRYVPQKESEAKNFNIVLVNADDAAAVRRGEVLAASAPSVLLVWVGSNPEFAAGHRLIERPIISIRFLGRLNSIVASDNVMSAATPVTTASAQPRRVLVVDDSLAMHKSCEIELRQVPWPIEIAYVSSGEEALEQIGNHPRFDLILLDVMMPGIDGYQTCEIIRKDPRYKETPVVMLSARTTKFDEMKGILSGCTAYLGKPIVHDPFQVLLKRLLC